MNAPDDPVAAPTEDRCAEDYDDHCFHFYEQGVPCCLCGFDYGDPE